MYIVNIPMFSGIILLVSLLQRIRGDFDVIKEQKKIASGPQLENNFGETPGESVITTVITEDDEKFDDNELGKVSEPNLKLYENLERERNRNDALETVRKIRATKNNTKTGMECLSCFANGTSKKDNYCYKGLDRKLKKVKCSDVEVCFTELNPLYLKRGCLLFGKVNKTFYCKCPLCNDKPSFEHSYYTYKTYSDWVYDNFLLQKPIKGIDGMCKVCETTGTNQLADKNCRLGRPADYMACGADQVCFVNIDDEVDHVSRGCRTRPVYNSLHVFCNQSLCNHVEMDPNTVFKNKLFKLMASPAIKSRSGTTRFFLTKTLLVFVFTFFMTEKKTF